METKSSIRLKVPFGQLHDKLVAPTENLAGGLACGCVCPGCGAKLLIKQGKKRRHFAHYNAPASDHCVERSIHSAAIQVLIEKKYLRLPEMRVEVSTYAMNGSKVWRAQTLRDEAVARFDECRAEVTFSKSDFGTIRPDVVGYRHERQLLVEMWFTHAVDAEKKTKIERLGLPTVEIYLGDLDLESGFEAIEQRVLECLPAKEWLFYPGVVEARARLQVEVDAKVARINEAFAKGQQEQRRRGDQLNAALLEQRRLREATKLEQDHALAEQKRRQEEEKAQRVQQYRGRSLGEKLLDVRRKLSMSGTWPRFLNFQTPHINAIDAPNKLWQAAVFHNFVFQAPLRETGFEPHQVMAWVRCWFGETTDSQTGLQDAVIGFLANLEKLGFIAWARYHTGGFVYSVLHNELALPLQTEATGRRGISGLTADEFAAVGHINSEVQWSMDWPDYDTVRKAVTRWVSMSQKDELRLLDALFVHRELLPTPIEFAMDMRKHMPATVVFNFLRNHSFVS